MKTLKFETKDEWFVARRGKITGTRLKDIIVKRGTGKKIGFYELIAERLGVPADDESAMERGARLEGEAVLQFIEAAKKKVNTDLVLWTRDDNESIALSPDGYIGTSEAVEAKCLSSARHIQALIEQKVPDEYEYQVLQYFIVNDNLKKLYFVFYDPRILVKPFFYLTVKRADVQEQVDECLAYERTTLAEVDKIVNELTF